MELSLPPSPAHLVGLRRAARVYLGEVASEAADDIVLTLNEAAANAILYGSGGGQPVQVVVHISDDVIVASVLDHGPDLPARPPTDADTDALGVRSRGLWLLRRLVDEMRLGSGASTITSNGAAGPSGPNACLLYGYSSVNSMLGFSARASRAGQPSRG
jgi:anti-sigma regulatory factor (Ser/Thr protein kinase)